MRGSAWPRRWRTSADRTVVRRAYYDQSVKRRSGATAPRGPQAEQLGIGFEGIEVVERSVVEPSPDTMRQIVSLRMPDALLVRVEEAAHARGVSPSSLMRALIAAGLDRSYAAVREPTDLGTEIADLRQLVEGLVARLGPDDTRG